MHMLESFLGSVCEARGAYEAWRYAGKEAAILAEGIHAVGPLHLPEWVDKGPRGYCYQTAMRAAVEHDHLRYVEGYALFQGIPLEHAWVYDMVTGAHYDPTWDQDGSEYYGVVFDTSFILSLSFCTERYGVWASERYDLLEAYMRDGFPEFAILQFGSNVPTTES